MPHPTTRRRRASPRLLSSGPRRTSSYLAVTWSPIFPCSLFHADQGRQPPPPTHPPPISLPSRSLGKKTKKKNPVRNSVEGKKKKLPPEPPERPWSVWFSFNCCAHHIHRTALINHGLRLGRSFSLVLQRKHSNCPDQRNRALSIFPIFSCFWQTLDTE